MKCLSCGDVSAEVCGTVHSPRARAETKHHRIPSSRRQTHSSFKSGCSQLVQKTVGPGWNANPIHYCAHSSQTNLIDYFHNSSTDATYLLLGLPSGPFPVAFPTRIYVQFSLTTYGLHAWPILSSDSKIKPFYYSGCCSLCGTFIHQ
jgi:hypothetical protein